MGEVVNYKNTDTQCFCQLKLESGERVLISIAAVPKPSIKVSKLLLGIIPFKTIWEYNPTMAGGYRAYVENLMSMFLEAEQGENIQPLDTIRNKLLPCTSSRDVLHVLLESEKNIRG